MEQALRTMIDERGPIGLAGCWIRSWQPEALRLVAGLLMSDTPLYHVLGTSGTPAAALEGVDYRVIRPGRKGDRWHYDAEISAGVLEAIDRGSAEHFVGER